MPMAHNLPFLPTGVGLDGTEIFWIDKYDFGLGEWQTYQATSAEIVTLAGFIAGAQLNDTNIFTKNQSVQPVTTTTSGSYAADASASNNFHITMNGNLTLANPTGMTAGMVLNFVLIEDGTGGRTITLGSNFKFPGGTVPTWVTAVGAKNFISAYYDGSVLICGGGAGYS